MSSIEPVSGDTSTGHGQERPLFSVVVPTSGRPTLARTLKSIRRQDRGDIEVLVVSDGEQPTAVSAVRDLNWEGVTCLVGPRTGTWGQAQRMLGMAHARGTYIAFMDDDDIYCRNAFHHIRRAVARNPGRIILFRMRRFDGILWRRPHIEQGEVATPQCVVPNATGQLGTWLTGKPASDYSFIKATSDLQGPPVWDRRVICIVRPFDWRNPAPWVRVRWDYWRGRIAIRTRLRRVLGAAQ